MDNRLQIPLDLPNTRILSATKTEQGDWLIRIESTLNGTVCHQCGRQTVHFHGLDEPVRLRHLPILGTPVYVEYRPQRYRCHFCEGKPTTTQQLSWHHHRSPNTQPYEKWLLRLLINSTVSDVARKLGVSEELVSGVLQRWVATAVNWDAYEQIKVLGLDEIAIKRGHRDYIVLVTTPLEPHGVAVLGVLANRQKQTVEDCLASIPTRLQRTIERVCSDMYPGFVNAAKAQLPWAKVVVDRFHVAQAYRDCADQVRKREVKRLKQTLSKEAFEPMKKAMWPFRKSPRALKEDEWMILEQLFAHSPKLKQAYLLREALTDIFEGAYTKPGAKCAIRAWCKRVRKSGIHEFDSFLGTVETWLDEISNYFLEGLNSGFVEGFNNRVKVLKRRCYGIFDVVHIFQRLTLDIHGYETFSSA